MSLFDAVATCTRDEDSNSLSMIDVSKTKDIVALLEMFRSKRTDITITVEDDGTITVQFSDDSVYEAQESSLEDELENFKFFLEQFNLEPMFSFYDSYDGIVRSTDYDTRSNNCATVVRSGDKILKHSLEEAGVSDFETLKKDICSCFMFVCDSLGFVNDTGKELLESLRILDYGSVARVLVDCSSDDIANKIKRTWGRAELDSCDLTGDVEAYWHMFDFKCNLHKSKRGTTVLEGWVSL